MKIGYKKKGQNLCLNGKAYLEIKRSYFAYSARILALGLCLFFSLNLLISCSPARSNEEIFATEQADSKNKIELPTPAVQQKAAEGELSIWWQNPDTYSPLQPGTVEQKGVYSLLYQTLFELDSSAGLKSEIVEKMSWSSDRLSLKLTIKKGIFFSDGNLLTPEDVRASILAWKNNQGWRILTEGEKWADYQPSEQNGDSDSDNDAEGIETIAPPEALDEEKDLDAEDPEEEKSESDDQPEGDLTAGSAEDLNFDQSLVGITADDLASKVDINELTFLPRSEGIKKIKSIETGADFVIIHLAGRCDNLSDYLNIPLVPRQYAEGLVWQLPPGTGKWRVKEQEIGGALSLLPRNPEIKMEIKVRVYPASDAAITAFMQNELDLLLLSAKIWPRYGGVRDLRHRKLPTGEFAYLQLYRDQGPLADRDYYLSFLKAFLRSSLCQDNPAGSWLYSPVPDKGGHQFMPPVEEIKNSLEEFAAGADLSLMDSEPVMPLLFVWPESDNYALVGEEIKRELRINKLPLVKKDEILVPEPTPDPNVTLTPTPTSSPTPTLDPNVIFLPSITVTPTPIPVMPSDLPKIKALELMIAEADYSEPYLYFNQLLGEAGDIEALSLLKEAYWQRLNSLSFATIDNEQPESKFAQRHAVTMALVELLDAGGVLGLASPCNVICYNQRIEGLTGASSEQPYEGLEEITIWP